MSSGNGSYSDRSRTSVHTSTYSQDCFANSWGRECAPYNTGSYTSCHNGQASTHSCRSRRWRVVFLRSVHN
jgi:hypothetical protein